MVSINKRGATKTVVIAVAIPARSPGSTIVWATLNLARKPVMNWRVRR